MSALYFGLFYYSEQTRVALPLLNVRAEASIKELAAQVKLTQTYGNDADYPIEAIYSFPIPVRAAVCSFVMIKQDGTRVVGRVQEKEKARQTYNTAVVRGQKAALMEQQHPDGESRMSLFHSPLTSVVQFSKLQRETSPPKSKSRSSWYTPQSLLKMKTTIPSASISLLTSALAMAEFPDPLPPL